MLAAGAGRFVLHPVLHARAVAGRPAGRGAARPAQQLSPASYLEDVEWETLLFFAGLFVMVGALVKVGLIDGIAHAPTSATGGNVATALPLLLFGSAILSAVVDNIPFVTTMSPVIAQPCPAGQPTAGKDVLWWALALGADLGGNATAIGASANVVVLGIAKRNGHPISFWEFTKYGLVVAPATVVVSLPYLWLRYLL